jgi:hypothetical protein
LPVNYRADFFWRIPPGKRETLAVASSSSPPIFMLIRQENLDSHAILYKLESETEYGAIRSKRQAGFLMGRRTGRGAENRANSRLPMPYPYRKSRLLKAEIDILFAALTALANRRIT